MSNHKILFICYGNVARSQMAQSYYNSLTKTNNAQSAGVSHKFFEGTNKYLHPAQDIIDAMNEEGIDISKNIVKGVTSEMIDSADKIYVMCDAQDVPEHILSNKKTTVWNIPDPYHHDFQFLRAVRDEIKEKVLDIIRNT